MMTPAELKAWRAGQGLSQPALAALLGVHEVTLSRWERGDRDIPPYLHLALEVLAARRKRRHATIDVFNPLVVEKDAYRAALEAIATVSPCVSCQVAKQEDPRQIARCTLARYKSDS